MMLKLPCKENSKATEMLIYHLDIASSENVVLFFSMEVLSGKMVGIVQWKQFQEMRHASLVFSTIHYLSNQIKT